LVPPPAGLSPAAIVAEANHRIANNLAVVAGLVHLQASEIRGAGRALSPEAACSLLEEVSSRISTVGQFHRLLAREQAGDVELSAYLHDVADAALTSMSRVGKLDLDIRARGDCTVPAAQALSIGLIVGEFVTNAVKYAHPGGVRGMVQIGCHGQDDGELLIWVADDGVGFPEGYDPGRDGGLGMRIVRNLASQLSARLSFESTSLGLKATLRIPRPEDSPAD
jgi:two-component sensor histidine kinase